MVNIGYIAVVDEVFENKPGLGDEYHTSDTENDRDGQGECALLRCDHSDHGHNDKYEARTYPTDGPDGQMNAGSIVEHVICVVAETRGHYP